MKKSKTISSKSKVKEAPIALNISRQIYDMAQSLFAIPNLSTADAVNQILDSFINSFKVGPGFLKDQDGNQTERFDSVIYIAGDKAEGAPIPADSAAAIIDVYENMNLQIFHSAYERIRQAKSLKKSPINCDSNILKTNVSLGIIFARVSDIALETLAEEINKLNSQTPHNQWPAMVVFATVGILNYPAHFPGQNILNEFHLATEDALEKGIPPIYIVKTVRPTGTHTINKMLEFLMAHLSIFCPEENQLDLREILEGVPSYGLTLSGYQYNLSGKLLPVPKEFYRDRYIPQMPLRIETKHGKLLAKIQFLKWQDGGVIMLDGKLPLLSLLVHLEKKGKDRAGVINLPGSPEAEISYVLPITQSDFDKLLIRFQEQSNMVVKSEPAKFLVQKLDDEGTRSPFVARLMMGIMNLRDNVFLEPGERVQFDNKYDLVLSALMSARSSMQKIIKLWTDHIRKVSSGEIIRQSEQSIQISENIDRELKREVENFINTSVRTLKQGMQNLVKDLQVDIGFLFKKQSTFDTGITALKSSDPLLADYLQQTRIWSEPLIDELRNKGLEHGMWSFPRIEYILNGTSVRALEPLILGLPMINYVSETFDRLACFVEDITVHSLQQQMPIGLTITEVGLEDRIAEAPLRFCATVTPGGLPEWQLKFHTSSFEET
jgi:hypothetical protein